MMKTNRIISMLFCAGILLGSSGVMQAVEQQFTVLKVEEATPEVKLSPVQEEFDQASMSETMTILLGIYLPVLAAIIGIPVSTLIYRAKAYGGLDVLLVSWRYALERGRDQLLLKYAKQHDDASLKRELILLNTTLLGDDWHAVRPKLVADFVDRNRFQFIKKYNSEMRERVMYLMNVYAAASDLYFNKYHPRTYLLPYFYTSTGSKAWGMHQLDSALGILE